MPEIPEKRSLWLFADNLEPEGRVFEFVELKLNYKTRNNKEIPVFVLLGSCKSKADEKEDLKGEFLLATFNVSNMKEIKAAAGAKSEDWTNKKFRLKPDGDKIRFELEPVVEKVTSNGFQ